jgi:hypothetical protein
MRQVLYIHQMELEPNDKKDKAKHDPHRSADSAGESLVLRCVGKGLDCQVSASGSVVVRHNGQVTCGASRSETYSEALR